MFEIPLLLTGLVAVGIPIAIHLLHRRKITPMQWGAMMFLQESDVLRKKRRHLDHWLLLLLRMAMLLLLVLLLAWPILPAGSVKQWTGGAASDVVIILDHSISTGIMDGRRTVFAHEIAVAKRIAGTLNPADTLSIVIAGHRPYSLTTFPIPVSNTAAVRSKLLSRLQQLPMGMAGASIPAALAEARRVARRGALIDKIIFVLSDQRTVSWQPRRAALWKAACGGAKAGPALAVFSVPVIPHDAKSDIAIGPLHLQPAFPVVGRRVKVLFNISNSGPLPVSHIPIDLVYDGAPMDHIVIPRLQAGHSTTGIMHLRIPAAGSHWIMVRTGIQDALAADNQSTAVVQAWKYIPVLIIDSQLGAVGDLRASRFLKTALQPSTSLDLGLAKPTVMSVSAAQTADLNKYQVVIVNDPPTLPSGLIARLHAFARSGKGVWFIFGRNANKTYVNNLLPQGGFAIGTLGPVVSAGKRHPIIVLHHADSSMLRPLRELNRNAIVAVTLLKWHQFTPAKTREKVLLATATGAPLMLSEAVGNSGGKVVIWTTGAAGHWNDWPLQAGSFLPLVNQTVYELAVGGRRLTTRPYLNPDAPIVWTGADTPAIASASILDPHGLIHSVTPQLITGGQYLITWNHTGLPGLYTLSFRPAGRRAKVYFNVNIDRTQLNPRLLSAADLQWLVGHHYIRKQIKADQIAAALGTVSSTLSLWPILAMLLLLLLVLETLQCRNMAKLVRAEDLPITELPPPRLLEH
ncbi:MAG: BatA domain-containing protein [Phycisphaerae bacterium]